MSKNGGKRGAALPEDVRSLIVRKLKHQQRAQARLWADTIQPIYSKLQDERLANIQARKMYRAFASVPMETYREVVAKAVAMTNQWPGTIWKTIESTLEKQDVVLINGAALSAIVDEFSWSVGKRPFTLDYVDPKRFKEFVYREANRYGGMREDHLVPFNRELELAAAAAQCAVLNTGRQAREAVNIVIEKYLIIHRSRSSGEQIMDRPVLLAKNEVYGSGAPCLPNPPRKQDDWFLAIKEMVLEFRRKNGRCPNEVEAWLELRNNPPASYGIERGMDRGEPAVFIDEKPLGRRTFGGRWKRYTQSEGNSEA